MENKTATISICIAVGLCGFGIMINWLYNNSKNEIEVANTTETTISSTTILETTKTTKKAVKTTKKKITKKVSGFNIKASKSEIQSYARQYIGNDDEYEAFDYIITRESYWNANAINKKSGASGLCQSLPASKMASAGKDYKINYKTQIHWCVSYCKSRYGSIQKAKQFWLKHHWF